MRLRGAGGGLLLQPTRSLNLDKAILTYTAQPSQLHISSRRGQLTLEGAMRLAKVMRTDVSTAALPLGAPLLCNNCTLPTSQTTISGKTFQWSQGLILDHTYATGSNLITRYQKMYDLGRLLGDGTLESRGVLIGDGLTSTE